MASVDLVNLDLPALDLLIGAPADFESRHAVNLGEYRDFVLELAGRARVDLAANSIDPRWWGYLAVDSASRRAIGTCGFRGGPDDEGTVEITYFTFPGFEGRGYGTVMAGGLVELARESGAARRVLAHTLPRRGPSTRVLEKLGFRLLGEHVDPVDGKVWRWALESGA